MDPAFQFGHLDPANQFTMEGLNMAFARELLLDGKPLPKTLFLDVMVEKTQKLIHHICEGTEMMVLGIEWLLDVLQSYVVPRQLRFSLYSGAVITEGWM